MYFRKIVHTGGILLVFLILNPVSSFAGWGQGHAYYPGGHMMGNGYMGWMMIFFWALLLIMLILVVRWVLRLSQLKGDPQTALELLKKRLASGEIDIEEFKEKKQFL